jgi:hypothetical protein
MSDGHKLIITGIKWNYLHSREIPAINPPIKGMPQTIVAYCMQCDALFNARDGSEPSRFVSAIAAVHLRHQCGIEEQFSVALLQDAH